MSDVVHIDTLLHAMAEQGLSVEDPKLRIAIRKATNPAGCEWCGARTKVGVVTGKTMKTACCGRKMN